MSFPPEKNESSDAAFGERLSDSFTAGSKDDQDRDLLLSSCEIDSELSVEEQNELAHLVQIDSKRIQDFRKSSLLLSQLLRSMPVIEFSDDILAHLVPAAETSKGSHETGAGSVRLLTLSAPPERAQRGARKHGASWATVSAMLAAVTLMIGLMSQTGKEGIPGGDSIPGGLVTLSQRPENPMSTESISSTVHAQGEDWQILVLKIGMTDRETVHEKVRQVAMASGLQMQTLDDRSRSARSSMEILLAAAPADPGIFVDSVRQSGVVLSEEWNPAEIANMNRSTLVSAVRASMLTPTKSELYFGEVYLALPKEPLVASAAPPVGARQDQMVGLHENDVKSVLRENSKPLPKTGVHASTSEFAGVAPEFADADAGLTAESRLSSVPQVQSDLTESGLTEPQKNAEDGRTPRVGASANQASRFLVVFQFD